MSLLFLCRLIDYVYVIAVYIDCNNRKKLLLDDDDLIVNLFILSILSVCIPSLSLAFTAFYRFPTVSLLAYINLECSYLCIAMHRLSTPL